MLQAQLIDLPPVASPPIWRPFTRVQERELGRHVHEVRRCFDWPGAPYHTMGEQEGVTFNRWVWHNLPLLAAMHHSPRLISKVAQLAGRPLKPSYCFLSMYGKDGVCPPHKDREQCVWTVDYVINTDADVGPWPLSIAGSLHTLAPGEAILYQGTEAEHSREPMHKTSDATFYNLAFFHFVPVEFVGSLA